MTRSCSTCGLVGADLEGSLQMEDRDTVLAAYEMRACGEPHRERCSRPVTRTYPVGLSISKPAISKCRSKAKARVIPSRRMTSKLTASTSEIP